MTPSTKAGNDGGKEDRKEVFYCWCGFESSEMKIFEFHPHRTRKQNGFDGEKK